MILLAAILIFAGFILYSMLTWYNPPQKLILAENAKPDHISCDSTLSVLSWNIGYAGLGDDRWLETHGSASLQIQNNSLNFLL